MSFSKQKVLIIDDEPGLLFSLTAFLEDEGFIVQSTSSGEEAIALLQNENFDAAIIDIRLPGMDGNAVMTEALAAGSKTRFLIHTGSADYQLPADLQSQGLSQNDVFLKPLPDLEILCTALQQRL